MFNIKTEIIFIQKHLLKNNFWFKLKKNIKNIPQISEEILSLKSSTIRLAVQL